ncbi:MAG TPA: hypothetical protein PKE25_04885, partial [Novosphingobium sp.]|nr:hypothetical protein [Novosphingobium sp.]
RALKPLPKARLTPLLLPPTPPLKALLPPPTLPPPLPPTPLPLLRTLLPLLATLPRRCNLRVFAKLPFQKDQGVSGKPGTPFSLRRTPCRDS